MLRGFIPAFLLTLLLVGLLGFAGRPALADDGADGLESLAGLLANVDNAALHRSLLEGMHDALQGRRNVKMPPSWPKAYQKLAQSADEQVRDRALALALIFGDKQALAAMRDTMMDAASPVERRAQALQLLVQSNAPQLAPLLQTLLDDEPMRGEAIRGLAAYDNAKTPGLLLARYEALTDAEKQDALTTLASRPAHATALLDAVEAKQIDPRDMSAFTARQIESLGDPEITARLRRLWGVVRQTSAERKAQIADLKRTLDDELLKKAVLASGRALFQKTCAQCHTLYGEGGKIGPDITGSDRANLDYILENVVDPSATVARAYRVTTFVLDDGRVISGIVAEQTPRTVAVQTVNGRVVLDRSAIDEQIPSEKSMMPDGLLDKLTADEVRDLIAYLRTKTPGEARMKDEG